MLLRIVSWCLLAAISSAQSDPTPRSGNIYGGNYLEVTREGEAVASAFPNVDGIDLLRTIASLPTGMIEPPIEPAEFLPEEGRALSYLFLSEPSSSSQPAVINSTKLKVDIQAAIHGNEPAADEVAMALLGKMDANQTWTVSILEKMDILVLPRYNVDGVHYFQRILASNFDPNREAIKLDRQQSRTIRRRFGEYAPHIAVDLHEFTAPTVYDISRDGGVDGNRSPVAQ